MAGQEKQPNQRGEVNFFPEPEILKKKLETFPDKEAILAYLNKYGIDLDQFLVWPERRGSYLSDLGILRHFLAGNIVIYPFKAENLTPNSYEVTLGEHYYRQKIKLSTSQKGYESPRHQFAPKPSKEPWLPILNPFDHTNIFFTWQLEKALEAEQFTLENDVSLEGIEPKDKIIVLKPHEMILAHTQEFIGGRNVVSTMISAKSSTGRSMLEICSDANLGHIGFVNRWTLEIRNKSDNFAIPLRVGDKYAQISFLETEPAAQAYQGQYQESFDLEQIFNSWVPLMMLPKGARQVNSQ